MKTRLGNEKGFSFLEIVIALGVIMILVAALVPVVSTQLDNAKIARTKDDVALIASAICQFNADTGEWPMWDKGTECGRDKGYNPILKSRDGEDPKIGSSGWTLLTSDYDWLEEQLVYNTPNGSADNHYPGPNEESTTAWRGPYLHGPNANSNQLVAGETLSVISKDPWGNKYLVNTEFLHPYYQSSEGVSAGNNHKVAYVLSAGPDEEIDTTYNQNLQAFQVGGDDIVCVIR